MSDLTRAVVEILEAKDDVLKARDYHSGKASERFANRRLRRALRDTQDAYKLNLAKTPVNVVADRMEVAAVTVAGNEVLTRILQTEVWDENELLFEMPSLIRSTCRDGDGYLLVWDGPEDGTVEMSYNSPLEGRMLYDPENPRRKLAYAHLWVENGTRYADVFYADRLEQFYQDEKADKPTDEGAWKQRTTAFREPEEGELETPGFTPDDLGVWPIPHDYGQVPAFHFRTERPWGVPLHKDAYGPQDAITKIVASHMGTMDYQVFPQRYALEEVGTEDTDELDEDDWEELTGSNATPSASGDPGKGLKAGPAEVWWLKGVKSVGQFEVADPKVFLDPAAFYMKMMAQTTNTPLHFFEPGGDQPSGESRRAANETLNKSVDNLKQSFGWTLSDALSFALLILGHGEVKVDVRWTSTEDPDDKDSWEKAEAKIRAGVPVAQVLQEQGYTATQVEKWLESSDEQDLTRKVAILDAIGDAVQKLGSGVGFGIVTAEQVAGIIAGVLDQGGDSGGE